MKLELIAALDTDISKERAVCAVRKDMTGRVFGRLTVMGLDRERGARRAYWKVLCVCGHEKSVMGSSLASGNTKSCGCLVRENAATFNRKHGMYLTPVYRVWVSMLDRCRNPRNKSYQNYGGRGVTVHPSWRSFQGFLADVGQPPFKGAELDRIDNDQGYGPVNFRWATSSVNNRNKRTNHVVTFQGVRMSLVAASDLSGVPAQTIRWRSLRGLPEDLVFARRKLKRMEGIENARCI